MTVQLKLTNSAAGTVTYTTIAASSQAETVPPNLAYLFWSSCNNAPLDNFLATGEIPLDPPLTNAPENLQWEGEHVIVESSISQFFDSRYTLCLSGGNPDWLTMNAVIDSIEFDFFHGRTSIIFGPYRHLDQKQFFDLLMMFRTRVAWDNPNVRATGQDSAAAGVQLGADTEKENTEHQSSLPPEAHGVGSPPRTGPNGSAQAPTQNVIQTDATGKTAGYIGVGAQIAGPATAPTQSPANGPQWQCASTDLTDVATQFLPAKFQWTSVCMTNPDGSMSTAFAKVLMTTPQPSAPPTPTKQLALNSQPSTQNDLSMDAAIYEPTTNRIFGVKGQWLYQFNAVTGAFIQGLRFTTDAQSPTSIATDGASATSIAVSALYFADWNCPNCFFRAIFLSSRRPRWR